MYASVNVRGADVVANNFAHMANAAGNYRPAWDDVRDEIMRNTLRQFLSGGRRGGGSWKQLTKPWLKYKLSRGYDRRILFMEHPLNRSVTVRNAAGQVYRTTPTTMIFGSSIEYAKVHQLGGGRNIPARPFLKILPGDRKKINKILSDHLMDAYR